MKRIILGIVLSWGIINPGYAENSVPMQKIDQFTQSMISPSIIDGDNQKNWSSFVKKLYDLYRSNHNNQPPLIGHFCVPENKTCINYMKFYDPKNDIGDSYTLNEVYDINDKLIEMNMCLYYRRGDIRDCGIYNNYSSHVISMKDRDGNWIPVK
jgi:hypothetical protein